MLALIEMTWGECYCQEPNYHPKMPTDDSNVSPLSVRQLLEVPCFTIKLELLLY